MLVLKMNMAIYPHVWWIKGLFLIVKGGLGACPTLYVIENNSEMHLVTETKGDNVNWQVIERILRLEKKKKKKVKYSKCDPIYKYITFFIVSSMTEGVSMVTKLVVVARSLDMLPEYTAMGLFSWYAAWITPASWNVPTRNNNIIINTRIQSHCEKV